jgi:thioredoxin reductase (NADPH)
MRRAFPGQFCGAVCRDEERLLTSKFVMIGATPNTDWLRSKLELDQSGFILTGSKLSYGASNFATSCPGVFAIGDVRSGSVKRVASAVGEGSAVISEVHRYIATLPR